MKIETDRETAIDILRYSGSHCCRRADHDLDDRMLQELTTASGLDADCSCSTSANFRSPTTPAWAISSGRGSPSCHGRPEIEAARFDSPFCGNRGDEAAPSTGGSSINGCFESG